MLKTFDEYSINENVKDKDYDIVINTHGDIDPFYNDDLCKKNTITYCHYPTAKSLIEKEDKDYLERYLKITRAYSFFYSSHNTFTSPHHHSSSSYVIQDDSDKDNNDNYDLENFNAVLKIIHYYKQQYLKWLKYAYNNMIKNTTLVTNSKFSRKAIFDECGIQDTIVLSPPVDVEKFRRFVFLHSSSREEKIEDDYRNAVSMRILTIMIKK
ncbi:MAG TPA: hypothetical protein VFX18_01100 [Candidatus Nitrosocosmicus sp.]|nr:hypothetical protein [Candidatus Nitrosocosmicus sp.]